MSVPYGVCERDTGRIIRAGQCPRSSFPAQETNANERVFRMTEDASLFRIDPATTSDEQVGFILLPSFPGDFDKLSIVSDGVDTATLSGLPTPCTVLVDGVENVITDGSITFTTSEPGLYFVEVQELEYKDKEWRLIADD